MLTNGESSSEANNINNEHIATEVDPSEKSANDISEKSANDIGEKSSNETDEKSANETGEKSANEISEKSATDMNIDTTGNRVIVGDDDILDDDAEVDFHTTLVNVWADISKELEVGFIVFSSKATL